jgi:dTDP-4-amino-4,6-dideoxygalactose transaminase
VATISAIVHCGATPVLVDVTSDYNMDVGQFERAHHAAHPRGHSRAPERAHGGHDTHHGDRREAQPGRRRRRRAIARRNRGRPRAGSIGTTGCFSFYPFKILAASATAVRLPPTTGRSQSRCRDCATTGRIERPASITSTATTALLDNVQAAVLDVKLRHLPSWIEHRRGIAERYSKGLAGVGDLRVPEVQDAAVP